MRWTAVLAGSAVAIASWMLLQLFGSGVALKMLDTYDYDRVHAIGIGSSAWSVIALVVSLFLGGLLAGKIDGHHEKRVAGLHGLLVWAVTAIVGVVSVTSSISMMAPSFLSRDLAVHGEEVRAHVMDAANTTGCAMLVASLALVLGVVAAVTGALAAAHTARKSHRRHDTMPGFTTAPYPIPPTPPAE
ncbi:MAG: hypothetical protein H0V17_34510 [Deltaproteobacteria bacterium]|nr:hypothetical protein [Deltaproteobacteria bacterium]